MNARWLWCAVPAMCLPAGLGCVGSSDDGSVSLGQAVLAIATAPADVSCVRITVTGSRVVTQMFDAQPGQSVLVAMDQLPIGNDTFLGEAFSQACSQVSATSVPTWLSDPVVVAVQTGSAVRVDLPLVHNGLANVNVDFVNDGTGAPGPADTAQYNFESGTQGWSASGAPIAPLTTTNAKHYLGASALEARFAGGSAAQPFISVNSPAVAPGSSITFHLLVPSGALVDWLQPYAIEQGGAWRYVGAWTAGASVTRDAWTTFQVAVPSDWAGVYQIGVDFSVHGGWSGSVYVDSIGW
jgi:hypothetical protein